MLAQEVICGPDPERHVSAIRKSAEAGFDHLWVHQVGPDQEGFFNLYRQEVPTQAPAPKQGARGFTAAVIKTREIDALGERHCPLSTVHCPLIYREGICSTSA